MFYDTFHWLLDKRFLFPWASTTNFDSHLWKGVLKRLLWDYKLGNICFGILCGSLVSSFGCYPRQVSGSNLKTFLEFKILKCVSMEKAKNKIILPNYHKNFKNPCNLHIPKQNQHIRWSMTLDYPQFCETWENKMLRRAQQLYLLPKDYKFFWKINRKTLSIRPQS